LDQTQAPISESEEIEESLCRTGGGRKVFRVGEWVGGCVVISHSLSLSLSLAVFPPSFWKLFKREKRGQRWQILQLRINLGTYYLVVEEARCDTVAVVPLLLVFSSFLSPAVSNRQNWFLRV
jgi:hypothetical protein